MRLLLVEDDARMRRLVHGGLAEEGHEVDSTDSAGTALKLAGRGHYDVIVLDVMLQAASGLEVVRSLRTTGNLTPVLMLTARDAAADIVAGLDAGADDYLTKPFAFAVLLARLRALGRRVSAPAGPRLHVADLRLDTDAHLVTRGGRPVLLTPTEFNLLECLLRQAGRVVTRERLIDHLWSTECDVRGNRLEAFVKSLRHKVDTADRPRLIHTIRGIGYCLREEPET
jgi:DNA-binding response OmpR family regulator